MSEDRGYRGRRAPAQGGARIAYVFDYGDEWRVQLSLLASEPAGEATYPRVIQRRGTAPPQYPPLDEGDLY